jgi:uncharacterized protein YqgC (DUF456 family)
MSLVLWLVGVLLVIVGIAGIVFPALPGHVLIFAGLLLAAWADDFTRVSGWTLALIGVIGALSYMVDFVAAALGGASVRARARSWARDSARSSASRSDFRACSSVRSPAPCSAS